MIVAHLIGGNEIEGINEGVVIIDGKQLEIGYKDLAYICGSISLGDLDTTQSETYLERDYIRLVRAHDEELGADFVFENHLTKYVCYSKYDINFETRTLTLKIETYN